MIQNAEAIPTRLSGVRKSAILMIILGEQASTEILREMEEDEVQAIGREIARMSSITSEQSESVLEEVYQMSVAHDYVSSGGMDYASKLVIGACGPEQGKSILDRSVKALR